MASDHHHHHHDDHHHHHSDGHPLGSHDHGWWEVGEHLVIIMGFIFLMMVIIEFLNILTRGRWEKILQGRRWRQYTMAALLGVLPGCLGAFVVISLYTHGTLTLGAVVTAMIATSGDEAFVMLAELPLTHSLGIMAGLVVVGIAVGAIVDRFWLKRAEDIDISCRDLHVHEHEPTVQLEWGAIWKSWKSPSWARLGLTLTIIAFLVAAATGWVGGHASWGIQVALVVFSSLGLILIALAPDHFIDEHVIHHVVSRHLPRLFLWTAGALVLIFLAVEYFQVEDLLHREYTLWGTLGLACLLGLLPTSGPHIIFILLYVQGSLPLSILVASSIVQDGHGTIPMLASTRKSFVIVKGINLLVGLAVGAAMLAFGW